MHRSKRYPASPEEPCPIHGLVTSILCDLRAKYPLSQRQLKPVYSSLRAIYRGCLYGDNLKDIIVLISSYELDLIHWRGPGYTISLCGLVVDPATCPGLIKDLRQAYRLMWKSRTITPSEEVKEEAFQRISAPRSHSLTSFDMDSLRAICANVLGPCPSNVLELPGRHGPGAVAEGYHGLEKWGLENFYPQLFKVGGISLLYFNERHILHSRKELTFLPHPITRYVEVPKDLRKNRVISCEPCTMQFLQQSVVNLLMDRMHKNSHRRIKFISQDEHIDVMRKASYLCSTIDLSDASDMISRRLVWNILPPDWRDLLFALRSRFMSDGITTIPIRSFAPMGSALCFPIESLVHYALITHFSEHKNRHISVYGDDIIIDRRNYRTVMSGLVKAGLVPNDKKCCSNGFFRETCGTDILLSGTDGDTVYDVSVSYFRGNLFKLGIKDIPNLQVVCRALHDTHMHKTKHCLMSYLYNTFLKRLPRRLITSREGSQYHWPPSDVLLFRPASTRWNRRFQREEVLASVLSIKTETSTPDNYEGLLASQCSDGMRKE